MKRLLSLITLLALLALPATALCQAPKVAVFPFKNNGQSQLNSLANGIAAMVTTNLTGMKGITVVEPRRVTATLLGIPLAGGAPSVEDALGAASALGADFAVTGEFVSFGSRFRIDLRLYDAKTGVLVMADKAQNKEDAMFDMVDELSAKAASFIGGQAPAEGGVLTVTSEPEGALVIIDDEEAGKTPLRKKLPEDTYTVDVTMEGYQGVTKKVEVPEKGTAKVEAKLIRLYGGIRVWWKEFPTSDINVSGEVIPMGIFTSNAMLVLSKYSRNIPAGSYTVTVRLPFKDESSWENVRTWKTYSAKFDLAPGEVMDIFINNDTFHPSVQATPCGSCAADWDFSTKLSWYE